MGYTLFRIDVVQYNHKTVAMGYSTDQYILKFNNVQQQQYHISYMTRIVSIMYPLCIAKVIIVYCYPFKTS